MRISDWSSDVCSSDLKINTAPAGSDAVQFGWVREHLRVLSANTPTEAIGEYGRMQRAGKLSDAQRYGLAYAHLLAGHGAEAAKELAPLRSEEHTSELQSLMRISYAVFCLKKKKKKDIKSQNT